MRNNYQECSYIHCGRLFYQHCRIERRTNSSVSVDGAPTSMLAICYEKLLRETSPDPNSIPPWDLSRRTLPPPQKL